MNKILCISHDASLTGAPILLLNLFPIIKKMGFSLNVLVKNQSGGIYNRFENGSDKCDYLYRKERQGLISRVKNKISRQGSVRNVNYLINDSDVILNNTITNGDILPFIKSKTDAPVLTYVHELEIATKTYTTEHDLNATIRCTDLFLTPCNSVRNYLNTELNIPVKKISILNYFIPQINLDAKEVKNSDLSMHFIVGGCGTTDWRKGVDIFILVLKRAVERHPDIPILFRWLGVNKSSVEYIRLMYDINKLGIADKIEFISSKTETSSFYKDLNLFLSPSREDPYPLVVLEAASYSIPSISFLEAGGAAEFISDDAGTVVPYLDVDKMAERVIQYYHDRQLLERNGKSAFEKFQNFHHNAQLISSQLNSAISKVNQGKMKVN